MTSLPLPHTAPEDVGLSTSRLARLGAVMRGEIERGRVPGAVALIARRGQLAYFESYGRLDPANAAPMAKDSIFRIYSMTKPIVSAAAMMLWEEGRFLLSDPAAKFLPELGNLKVAVTRGSEIDLVLGTKFIALRPNDAARTALLDSAGLGQLMQVVPPRGGLASQAGPLQTASTQSTVPVVDPSLLRRARQVTC